MAYAIKHVYAIKCENECSLQLATGYLSLRHFLMLCFYCAVMGN